MFRLAAAIISSVISMPMTCPDVPTFLAASSMAFPKINADTYCGEDGNAYVSWSVDSYDIWSSAGENPDVLIEIMIDNGDWIEVDRGAFVARAGAPLQRLRDAGLRLDRGLER